MNSLGSYAFFLAGSSAFCLAAAAAAERVATGEGSDATMAVAAAAATARVVCCSLLFSLLVWVGGCDDLAIILGSLKYLISGAAWEAVCYSSAHSDQ